MGYGSRRPARVPLLTERHRLQRLTWARDHLGWTLDDWKTVAWSDESRSQLIRVDSSVRVWRRPHEAMDPSCQQGTVQAGSGSVMVWGFYVEWTGSSGPTETIVDCKWICSAPWRPPAAIQ